ncbi:TolB-like translocation protein [Robertkochia sediminum]|uniref:PD40 domain-containing protein n=1 Tax=Robertkochia sediminum TaxID=2785326 RepID=UPI001931553F|nr:PD40 domain-containing protein [Robertkochia sediminum]MBL7472037.1 PD40 domain-containing protein [Robertkochia sediminum]
MLAILSVGCTSGKGPFAAYSDAVSPEKLGAGTFSADGVQWNNVYVAQTGEWYFTKMEASASVIHKMNEENGTFSPSEALPFPAGSPHSDVYVNEEGNTMLFSSLMPEHAQDTVTDWNIWMSKRKDGSWTAPKPFFDKPVEGNQFYPWLTDSGNLYFAITPHGSSNSDLYVAPYVNGEYKAPRALTSVNSEHLEGDAFVAPDESYMIFAAFDRQQNLGRSDLFISFRKKGSWSAPVWLGETINSEGYDGSPFVTKDGRFLIFTSSRGSTDENTFFNHYIIPLEIDKYRSK